MAVVPAYIKKDGTVVYKAEPSTSPGTEKVTKTVYTGQGDTRLREFESGRVEEVSGNRASGNLTVQTVYDPSKNLNETATKLESAGNTRTASDVREYAKGLQTVGYAETSRQFDIYSQQKNQARLEQERRQAQTQPVTQTQNQQVYSRQSPLRSNLPSTEVTIKRTKSPQETIDKTSTFSTAGIETVKDESPFSLGQTEYSKRFDARYEQLDSSVFGNEFLTKGRRDFFLVVDKTIQRVEGSVPAQSGTTDFSATAVSQLGIGVVKGGFSIAEAIYYPTKTVKETAYAINNPVETTKQIAGEFVTKPSETAGYFAGQLIATEGIGILFKRGLIKVAEQRTVRQISKIDERVPTEKYYYSNDFISDRPLKSYEGVLIENKFISSAQKDAIQNQAGFKANYGIPTEKGVQKQLYPAEFRQEAVPLTIQQPLEISKASEVIKVEGTNPAGVEFSKTIQEKQIPLTKSNLYTTNDYGLKSIENLQATTQRVVIEEKFNVKTGEQYPLISEVTGETYFKSKSDIITFKDTGYSSFSEYKTPVKEKGNLFTSLAVKTFNNKYPIFLEGETSQLTKGESVFKDRVSPLEIPKTIEPESPRVLKEQKDRGVIYYTLKEETTPTRVYSPKFKSISSVSPVTKPIQAQSPILDNRFRIDQTTTPEQIPNTRSILDTRQTTEQKNEQEIIPKQDLTFEERPVTQEKYKARDVFKTEKPKVESPGALIDFEPQTTTKESKGGLFTVSVRRGGVFKTVGKTTSLASAIQKGKAITGSTASASFKVTGGTQSETRATARKILGTRSFYESKKEKGVFIEKPGYRIKSPGEKREITYKGIQSRKKFGGFRI